MNAAAWTAVGLILGWLAHRFLSDGSPSSRWMYLAMGVVGAFVGVQLLAPPANPSAPDPNVFNGVLSLYAAVGASSLLFVANLVRGRMKR